MGCLNTAQWRAVLLGVILGLVLPGVAGAQAPKAGGRLIHGDSQEPDLLNPLLSNQIATFQVASAIYSYLTRVNDKGEIVADLATPVPTVANGGISRDGLTYTFRIHRTALFHDGKPVTVADVKFTYETIINPKVRATRRTGFDLVSAVETPDDHTITFRLKKVYPPFIEAWSYAPILPKHLLDGKDVNTDRFNRNPIGSGPFVFKEWVAGSHITLEKNRRYFKSGLPYLDTVIYKIVKDKNVLLAQLQTGEVDTYFFVSTVQVPQVRQLGHVNFFSTPIASHFLIMMNVKDPIVGDVVVRRALAHGFDKVAITQTILQGLVDPAWTSVHPLSWAFKRDVMKFEYNPARARQLLADAGWMPGPDGIREKGGQKLSLEIANIAGDPERLQILQVIQRQWREIGVDLQIKPVDVPTMFGRMLPRREFQMTYSFWSTDLDPDLTQSYRTGEPRNFFQYSNPKADTLLEQGTATLDLERRARVYSEFQDVLEQDVPALRIYWRRMFDAASKKVHHIKPTPSNIGTNFWNVEEWWKE